jgi:uncharacterized glyoxalase superfamily protein PhnB
MSQRDLAYAPLAVELFVPDVAEAAAFYTEKLGFQTVRFDPPGSDNPAFALATLGTVEFMFMHERFYTGNQPLERRGEGVDIRVMVDDVDAMNERAISAGMTITHPIADRDYGLRDFIVRDPWGFRLRFASPLG